MELRSLAIAALAACSGAPARPAPEHAPTPPADASPGEVARADAAPIDASPVASIDAAVVDAGPAVRALAPACTGGDLDLRALMDAGSCDDARLGVQPLPAGIEIAVDPPLAAKRGATAYSDLVLTNVTAAPIELHLRSLCGSADQVETSLFDRGGRRVDLLERCGSGGGCGATVLAIRLPPRGRARFAFAISTIQRRHDESCREIDVGPLRAGRYRAEIRALFLDAPVSAPLVVR